MLRASSSSSCHGNCVVRLIPQRNQKKEASEFIITKMTVLEAVKPARLSHYHVFEISGVYLYDN